MKVSFCESETSYRSSAAQRLSLPVKAAALEEYLLANPLASPNAEEICEEPAPADWPVGYSEVDSDVVFWPSSMNLLFFVASPTEERYERIMSTEKTTAAAPMAMDGSPCPKRMQETSTLAIC